MFTGHFFSISDTKKLKQKQTTSICWIISYASGTVLGSKPTLAYMNDQAPAQDYSLFHGDTFHNTPKLAVFPSPPQHPRGPPTHTEARTIWWQAYEASFSTPVLKFLNTESKSYNNRSLEDFEKWHAQKVWRMGWAHNSEFKSRRLWTMKTRRMILERWLFQQ